MSREYHGGVILPGLVGFLAGLAFACLMAGRADGSSPADVDGMVWIPPGEFIMGTDRTDTAQEALALGLPDPWYEDEHPLLRVELPGFYIDRYEVTNRRYHAFVQATGHPPPAGWVGGGFPEGRADYPVVYVNWDDASAFCRWEGKRLPTEAEWEKAARGPAGYEYPWGNDFDPARAHIARAATMAGEPVAVGQYEAGRSPYGVYDMIGNVWEWTASWYTAYPGNPSRSEKFGRVFRVIRGLSFMGLGHYPPELYQRVAAVVARASFRSYDLPSARLPDVGFRCARSGG